MNERVYTNPTGITNQERLSQALRARRRALKLTQQQLAERALVSRRTITNAETAENIGLKELCKIANALGYELTLQPKDSISYEALATYFKDDE